MKTRILKTLLCSTLALLFLGVSAVPSSAGGASSASRGCYGVHGRLVCHGHSVPRQSTYVCLHMTRKLLELMGLQETINGGIYSSAGLLADGTLVGLPLGVVLGLLGIWSGIGGGALMWYANSDYFHPGVYCGYV